MKKKLTILTYILVVIGIIALVVCYIAIPNETRLAMDKVFEYANTPIVIGGFCTTIGCIGIYIIFKLLLEKTSFGKGKLKELEEKVNEKDKKQTDIVDTLRNDYETSMNTLEAFGNSVLDKFKNYDKALSLIPNKKVQEALNDGTERSSENKE